MLRLKDGLILYHGSYCEVKEPDLAKCAKRKDFGQGFYLTTSKEQAASFLKTSIAKAIAAGKIEENQNFGYISTYDAEVEHEMAMYDVIIGKIADDATNAIQEVDEALAIINKQRSLFGAYQNRMEHAIAINNITAENTAAAESRIRDAEIADEMVKHAKESILQQVAQAMLAQANDSAEGILPLLQ